MSAMPLSEAVLVPGADDAALWLAGLAQSDLAGRFRVSSSSHQTLEILQDKARFGEYLARTRIPHPRTFSIACSSDIEVIPFDALDKVFIKPADSQHFSQVTGQKGVWVRSRNELESVWERLDADGFKLIAQEYIPGSAADHYFVDGFRDRHGVLTGLFARRRLRIFPADFGNSSYCQSIPLRDVAGAVDSLSELLQQLNYRGIFSAEFKRDARDGVYRLLEVNTRAWWYIEFAARCGVNVCRMAVEDALDLPVTVATRAYPVGAGCVSLAGDVQTVFSRRDQRPSWLKVLGQWATAHYHVFRWNDPRPGLSVLWQLLRRRVAWRPRRTSADATSAAVVARSPMQQGASKR
ncbi:hypothetical protein ACFOLC_02240 [Lysobacter cavernae]|uniref:ATP-grasp domain-containing protein n=1 Tax=Lysobacter cavernae TaxID=1685901 RepID=A0ABV7RL11_9GAMM